MASTHMQVAALRPPDDTEESILGVDRHQLDIRTVRGGVKEEAHRAARSGGSPGHLPWQAISQIMLTGCVRSDGSPYTVYPDVMVFPRPMDRGRGSYSVAAGLERRIAAADGSGLDALLRRASTAQSAAEV